MASLFSSSVRLILVLVLISCMVIEYSASDFNQDFDITWGNGRGKIINNGEILTLTLDNTSGSGFVSKREYLFGKIDMQIKLVRGNSAGTVTAYYVTVLFIYFFQEYWLFVLIVMLFDVGIFLFFDIVVIRRIKS